MKLRVLIVAIIATVPLFTGISYAAGDLIVNGNLGVGATPASPNRAEVNGNLKVDGSAVVSSVTFSDGSVQTTAKRLVWDYTVTGSAVTSVTSPTLDGVTDGGYEFEFVIVGGATNGITPRFYYNNDQINTDYWVARVGSAWANDSRMADNLPYAAVYIARGTISITPSGALSTYYNWAIHPNSDGGDWIHNKTTAVTNLTRIDIVASATNGIGVNSRFRLWKKNY